MKKLIILLIALVAVNGAMAQWIPQNSGISTHLLSVYFTDSNTGYIGGYNNQLLKTQDGGATWETSNPNAEFGYIFSITFTDANTGYVGGLWAGGYDILTTVDAGLTWTYNQTCCDAVPLFSIFFADTNIGYALGDEDGGGWHYYIYKTIDGGTTWFAVSGGEGEQFSSIFFTDATTGFAVGTSIIKTTDGGTTWDTVFDVGGLSVYFTDANTGFAVGTSIIKTTDGGITWDTVFDVLPPGWLSSVYFTDASTGYAVGDSGTIIKTIDAGLTWEVQSSGTTNDLQSIYFPTFDTGYIVGNNGTLLKTTNGGGNPVGIHENPQPASLNIYPNPAKDKIIISSPAMTGITQLSIFNVSGEKVMERKLTDNETQIDISTLPRGVYFVRLQNEKMVEVGKIVKE